MMKDLYELYKGKDLVTKEEVSKMINNYNNNISNCFIRYKHIVDQIPAGVGRVLDYGCGWGCITKAIAEKNNNVIGVDSFNGALEVAKDFNPHPRVRYLNSSEIKKLKPESFDYINSNQVLEHVHNPGIYLKNINLLCKIGGFLVISVPNVINLRFIFRQLRKSLEKNFAILSEKILSSYAKDSDHIQGWDPEAFVRLHASLGFKYIKHKFIEGMYLPYGKYKHVTVPWGGCYYHTKNNRLKNLSRTMLFKFQKVKFVNIDPCD